MYYLLISILLSLPAFSADEPQKNSPKPKKTKYYSSPFMVKIYKGGVVRPLQIPYDKFLGLRDLSVEDLILELQDRGVDFYFPNPYRISTLKQEFMNSINDELEKIPDEKFGTLAKRIEFKNKIENASGIGSQVNAGTNGKNQQIISGENGNIVLLPMSRDRGLITLYQEPINRETIIHEYAHVLQFDYMGTNKVNEQSVDVLSFQGYWARKTAMSFGAQVEKVKNSQPLSAAEQRSMVYANYFGFLIQARMKLAELDAIYITYLLDQKGYVSFPMEEKVLMTQYFHQNRTELNQVINNFYQNEIIELAVSDPKALKEFEDSIKVVEAIKERISTLTAKQFVFQRRR